MDALLVNHADVEGGKVEDEAAVQLEGGAEKREKVFKTTRKRVESL